VSWGEGAGWVVREGVGTGGEMTQVLYAHMNNEKIKIKKKKKRSYGVKCSF
jgi:NaMN:DMB phosphoribosyltransferase